MITAIVLVKAAADQIPEAAQAIAGLKDVAEVYSCAGDGDVDIIAIVRAPEHEQLADVIAGRLSQSHGVLNTNAPESRSGTTYARTQKSRSGSASTTLPDVAGLF